ncbi:MAG: hypothetical protein KDA25_12760, partial [Phycisphaerales bacterium]|nr:hypothetical protein [Phycisphaerales bacterium]
MSATDTIRSSRRRSMLVMASERTSDRLPAEWRGAERADSIYDALGRLARPDVAGPIGRIAVDDAQIATCRPEAGEALRRLDPGVELVLLGTGPSARMREIAADAG